MVEHLPCKQMAVGSSPTFSTFRHLDGESAWSASVTVARLALNHAVGVQVSGGLLNQRSWSDDHRSSNALLVQWQVRLSSKQDIGVRFPGEALGCQAIGLPLLWSTRIRVVHISVKDVVGVQFSGRPRSKPLACGSSVCKLA